MRLFGVLKLCLHFRDGLAAHVQLLPIAKNLLPLSRLLPLPQCASLWMRQAASWQDTAKNCRELRSIWAKPANTKQPSPLQGRPGLQRCSAAEFHDEIVLCKAKHTLALGKGPSWGALWG